MLSPALVGWLRRLGLWSAGRKAHRLLAPPLCVTFHRVVRTMGDRFLPVDLVLKHDYDYRLVHLDPKLITGTLLADGGLMTKERRRESRFERYRRWRDLGGEWKNLNRHVSRNFHGRFIAEGDWDIQARPFEVRASIVQLFGEGRQPEGTAEYQRLLGRVKSGDLAWSRGLRSERDIGRYFEQLVRVFEDIRVGGYRTQAELGADGSDEICLCIDRNGQPTILGGGTHRLSIALTLGLERVPVLIKRVHASWAIECVRRYGGTISTAIDAGIKALETDSGSASI